jgi:acylphosphatase
MSETISIRVLIEGRVQGVRYRAWCVEEASLLGLSGWVRNRRYNSVEALFSGPEIIVGKMLERRWGGSILAQVSSIIDEPCAPPKSGFHQLPTC